MHKFLTVPLNNNKLSNYQATVAQEYLSYDITAAEESSTDMLLLVCKQLNKCICSNALTEAFIYNKITDNPHSLNTMHSD